MMLRWVKARYAAAEEPAHLRSGRWGEGVAVRFLKKHHYRIAGERVRVGRHDELDIVAERASTLVFVEVKTRRNEQYGRPFSAVNRDKRKRLSRAAVGYLRKKKLTPAFIRFDLIEVIGAPDDGRAPEIRHIENAFTLDPAYKLWW
ncbi:MAG: YraN family protein [Pontiellaceae bacterium]|nr:YraN family protein [Pontiellaceae bacterium]MBN2786019.1 YraN family protein [Pontiellaceae bacterium]